MTLLICLLQGAGEGEGLGLSPPAGAAEEGSFHIRGGGGAHPHLSKDGVPEAVYFTRLPYIAEDYPNTPQLMAQLEAFGKKVSQGF